MISESKVINIINNYLPKSADPTLRQLFPLNTSKFRRSRLLYGDLIDFLGDIYVCNGLDENYEDNDIGKELIDVIHFLAFCTDGKKF